MEKTPHYVGEKRDPRNPPSPKEAKTERRAQKLEAEAEDEAETDSKG